MFVWINVKESINKYLRINYIWFFPLLAFALFQLVFWLSKFQQVLDYSKIDHNSLLTINLTLAGFLLTGIGIMITVRDKDFIKTLIKMRYWQKVELSAFIGIIFNILSALISLSTLIIISDSPYILNIELSTFLIGLTYFIMVAIWLKKAFNYL